MKTVRRTLVLRCVTAVAVAGLAGCSSSSGGGGTGGDGGGGGGGSTESVSCDDLATFITENATVGNTQEMAPLMAELFSCVSLSADQARDLLETNLSNQADINQIFAQFNL